MTLAATAHHQSLVPALCTRCGAAPLVDASWSAWKCPSCSTTHRVRRCARCAKPAQVSAAFNDKVGAWFNCGGCGFKNQVRLGSRPAPASLGDIEQPADRGFPVYDPEFVCLIGCTVVGGYNAPVPTGAVVNLVSSTAVLKYQRCDMRPAAWTAEVPVTDFVRVEVGGPGVQQTGGGFIGGGFGVTGAVEGMLVASLLNSLTTKTTVNTLVRLVAQDHETVLHTSVLTPAIAEQRLVALRGRAEANARQAAATPPVGTGLASELATLSELHSSGALSLEEFQAAKQQLLARN